MAEQEKQDLMEHPEMKRLLVRQEEQRQRLILFLQNPKPRFVAQGSMAGWMVTDRMTGEFVDGPFDTQQQAINAIVFDELNGSEGDR